MEQGMIVIVIIIIVVLLIVILLACLSMRSRKRRHRRRHDGVTTHKHPRYAVRSANDQEDLEERRKVSANGKFNKKIGNKWGQSRVKKHNKKAGKGYYYKSDGTPYTV